MPRKKKIEVVVNAVEDKAVATEVEVKKTARAASRKAKAKAEQAAEQVADTAVATEIEVKKTARATGRKAKAKVEEAAEQVAEAAAATEIEVKKAAGKAKRSVKKTGEKAAEAAKAPARRARAAKLDIVIQSAMGGAISTTEIASKVPKDAVSAYVKVEENKIYWVDKDGETGDVEIW